MPYAPNVAYRGDQYLFSAISGIGNDFAEAMKKTEELRKQAGLNDAIVQHALATGRITQDQANEYTQAPWGKKQGIANGIIANVHDDWQRSQFAQEEQDKAAQRALQLRIAQMGQQTSPMSGQTYYHPDTGEAVGIYGPNGQVQFFPSSAQPGGNDVNVLPLIDPTTKQPVPGKGVVDKTGMVVDTSPTQPDVILDPSKKFFLDHKTNSWKPLPSKTARMLQNDAAPSIDTAPQPSALGRLYNWAFGGPAPQGPAQPTAPVVGAAPGVGPAAPTLATTPVKVNSQADYDQLQSGTVYIAPDGSIRKKP